MSTRVVSQTVVTCDVCGMETTEGLSASGLFSASGKMQLTDTGVSRDMDLCNMCLNAVHDLIATRKLTGTFDREREAKGK